MRLMDTHCHAHFPAYSDETAITDALKNDIGLLLVGTELTTSRDAVAVAGRYPHAPVYASVGIHPAHVYEPHHDTNELKNAPSAAVFYETDFAPLLDSSRVIAVGECGLDLSRIPSSLTRSEYLTMQTALFHAQVMFAHAHHLPLIIHTRDAHEETISLLMEWKQAGLAQQGGIIHSFTGTRIEADAYIALGFCIGVNGIITFPARKGQEEAHRALLDAVQTIPDHALVLETDAPYLTPVPHRGEQNLPAYVSYVADAVAHLRAVTVEDIARITTENAKRLFRLDKEEMGNLY
jgi:TatD DNase family protein